MKKIQLVQLILFVLTFFGTLLSGTEWRYGKSFFYSGPIEISDLLGGLPYAISLLAILTVHEFGHYLYALKHRVKTTLPFYLPLYLGFLPLFMPSFGTMGAFIAIRDKVPSRKAYFDIGVSGPLAGFVVAVVVIVLGFITLPPLDYLFRIHPEYMSLGENYRDYVAPSGAGGVSMSFGDNLLFLFLKEVLPYSRVDFPAPGEIVHYPLLMVGYISLLFTALNLLPIGQLDGGHMIYGMFGKRVHSLVSRIAYVALLSYVGLGIVSPEPISFGLFIKIIIYVYFLYVCLYNVVKDPQYRLVAALGIFTGQFLVTYLIRDVSGFPLLILMALVIGRLIGIDHPEAEDETGLNPIRKFVGVLTILVFVVILSPRPIKFIFPEDSAVEKTSSETSYHSPPAADLPEITQL